MSSIIASPPPVSWAQRCCSVFLTFNVECEKPDINIEKNTVTFKGTCTPDQKFHEVIIPLYADIDPSKSSYTNKGRLIEVILSKAKGDDPFWPTLTSDQKKHHWLKVDFNRWQDEDESGEELDEVNDMFSSKLGDFGDENDKDDSSSEDDLPDIA